MGRIVVILLALVAVVGCADEAPDATPEGALSELLEALEESRYDDRRLADVYALLDEASRRELSDRATRAEALGRTGLEPWDMIAIGRHHLAFEPTRYEAQVEGERGVVVAHGRGGRRAEVPVVHEAEGWRVVLFAGEPAPEPDADPAEDGEAETVTP
ncbi:MAG: hypothetical protein CMN30_34270 [Sandaracinus sp.]|nr:hypothetical protein [Sandaracinus sp.]